MFEEKITIPGEYGIEETLVIIHSHERSNLGALQHFLNSAKFAFRKIQNFPKESVFNSDTPNAKFPNVQELNALVDMLLTMWLNWSKQQVDHNKSYHPVLSRVDIEVEINLQDELWVSFSDPNKQIGGSIELSGKVSLWKHLPSKNAGEIEKHFISTQINPSSSNSWIFNFLFDADTLLIRDTRNLELFDAEKLEAVLYQAEDLDK